MITLQKVQQDKPRELTLVQDLAREIWQEHYTPIIGPEQVQYMLQEFQSSAAIAAQIADGFTYYLLFWGSRPAGYLGYVQQPQATELQLSKLYVLQDLRGCGLGRAGLELVQEQALQQGLDLIWLAVNKYNQDSIAWYRHMGFEVARALVTDIGSGFIMDDYLLEKRL